MPPHAGVSSQELNLPFVTVLYLQGHPLPAQRDAGVPSPHGVLPPPWPLRSPTPAVPLPRSSVGTLTPAGLHVVPL